MEQLKESLEKNKKIRKKLNTNQLNLPLKNISVSSKFKDEKIVTVEINKEFDVLDKAWGNKVFVKLFVAARTSGLLKKISDREFKTLIALSLYMNENGDCYPSQDQVARDLGCSRETANRRIQSLLRFRFNGKPIIQALKKRNKQGKWENIYYTILPVSQLKIFEKPTKKEVRDAHVTKSSHRPCDDIAIWQNRHTNYNHYLNKNNNVKDNVILKKRKRSQEKELLAKEISEQLEDGHSLGFYRKIVDLIPENLIYQALSEVKDTYLMGKVKKNRAALFNSVIQAKANKNNIKLGINKARKEKT